MQCPVFSNTVTDTSKGQRDYITVNALKIGMTVVQLDKPWSESEFLEQGFRIEDQVDIDDLKAECKFVYIEKQEDLSESTIATGNNEMKDFDWGKLSRG